MTCDICGEMSNTRDEDKTCRNKSCFYSHFIHISQRVVELDEHKLTIQLVTWGIFLKTYITWVAAIVKSRKKYCQFILIINMLVCSILV